MENQREVTAWAYPQDALVTLCERCNAKEWVLETPEVQRWLLDKYFEATTRKAGEQKNDEHNE